MIIAVIYVIISFLLDSILSTYFPSTISNLSYFNTIYSIISLVIIYSYFQNDKKYIIILVILGIIFDIVYTNTFLVNVVIFFIIYLIVKNLDYIIPDNLFTINVKSLISIYIYHILTYILLLLTNYNNCNLLVLGNILIRSTVMTIIYTSISYILFKKIYNKKYDRKIK